MSEHEAIRELIDRVRTRWRTRRVLHALVRACLAVAAALISWFVAAQVVGASQLAALAAITLAVLALVAVGAGVVWAMLPLRRVPSDRQLARYIEERSPSLEDRLVTAVDVIGRDGPTPLLAEPML